MREIVLDTETTGLDPANGDKIVEIGCIELIDHMPSGEEFHRYINPQRDMPPGAEKVHGLSAKFLSDYDIFAASIDDFLGFIGSDPLIIHNAGFDMKFINAELKACGREILPMARAIDTLEMARRKFPGASASLDALCRRFEIDTSSRDKHGALIDSHLLSQVYLELIGGRQHGLVLAAEAQSGGGAGEATSGAGAAGSAPSLEGRASARTPRPHGPSAEEEVRHKAMLELLKSPLWTTG
ncbi:MAG: DNA polymerase III subunit epsilon [Rhodospirillaceae bacterium]|jgi:DNA polymerase-3 subunit epsilon|nr:DNA polymerase III subunit epsilon [Rhodospirillaceae bacterium]MBT5373060.1 DNA polymerase III subunit epsilon [Rhodospirillaceae bacterium]MBT5659156.1 DNA polymerase III subunit epsilon [Rhodospirillaceae bacterium]MBT5752618.1 DNA polymerase III subunit epsilon [Rhodospirillaceae bacterium]